MLQSRGYAFSDLIFALGSRNFCGTVVTMDMQMKVPELHLTSPYDWRRGPKGTGASEHGFPSLSG